MVTFKGMDDAAMQAFAVKVEGAASRLHASHGALSNMLNATPWLGGFADRFVQDWRGPHSARVRAAEALLQRVAGDLRREASAQEGASVAGGGALALGSPLLQQCVVPPEDGRVYARSTVGFGTTTDVGYGVHKNVAGSTTTTFNSDGSMDVAVSSKTSVEMSLMEIVTLATFLANPAAGLVSAVASDNKKLKAKFGAEVGTSRTVTYFYNDTSTATYSTFLDGQAGWSKLATGYDENDLRTDAAKVGQDPSAVRTTSAAVHGSFELGAKQGNSAVGLRIAGEVETFNTLYQNGQAGTGFSFSTEHNVTGKVDLGPVDVGGGGAVLSGGEVEVIRDGAGTPVRVVIRESGSVDVSVSAQSGVVSQSATQGAGWARTQTFDLTDPAVSRAFGGHTDPVSAAQVAGRHPELASTNMVVTSNASDTIDTDLKVYGVSGTGTTSETTGAWHRDPGGTWVRLP